MIVKTNIKNIANIQTGVYLKEEMPHGEVQYLQVKNFNQDLTPVLLYPSIPLNDKVKKYLLFEGDILFASKGFFNFCIVYREEWGNAVASTSFLVLKIKDKADILPEYLCWVLNRSDVRSYFQHETAGSVMPSITKAMLEEYEIDIPSIDIQQKITDVVSLQQREQVISEKLLILKNNLTQNKLIKIFKNK